MVDALYSPASAGERRRKGIITNKGGPYGATRRTATSYQNTIRPNNLISIVKSELYLV